MEKVKQQSNVWTWTLDKLLFSCVWQVLPRYLPISHDFFWSRFSRNSLYWQRKSLIRVTHSWTKIKTQSIRMNDDASIKKSLFYIYEKNITWKKHSILSSSFFFLFLRSCFFLLTCSSHRFCQISKLFARRFFCFVNFQSFIQISQ